MSFVNCSKVCVNDSNIKGGGSGAFANEDIKKGELVESGIVRRVSINGHCCPYVFTWSEDRTIWAIGSGCSTFYNSSQNPNTSMIRNFDQDTFEIYALQDISKGEELTHKYKSLEWRKCFIGLNNS
tara:strand:+ start:2009 stop:2386 length:378 start_codon:yes stop_codon:yes gene_type:complete